jgi:FkbM family methyltransferase
MWVAASSLLLSRLLGRNNAVVRRNGVWVSSGTKSGQGSYCAIAGLDYEPELRWILSKLSSGDIFIDVGANIGIYSIHAAKKVGPKGRVFAIEPSKGATTHLRENVRLNNLSDTITVVNAAASEKSGKLFLSGNPDQWNSLQLSPSPPGEEIQVTTIDEIISFHSNINSSVKCIKIDAEGAETEILNGSEKTLHNHHPIVVFENIFKNTQNQTATFLKFLGYTIYFLDEHFSLKHYNQFTPSNAANLIAFHDDHP